MTSTNLIQQMTKKCRRLAASARNTDDRTFWLGLVERWQAVESRSARQHCLGRGPLMGRLQKHSLGRGENAAGASPSHDGSSQPAR